MPAPDPPLLPDHVAQTIEAIAELQREHHRRATPSERLVGQLTGMVARPRFVGLLSLAIGLWLLINLTLVLAGRPALDPAPFEGLQVVASVTGVYIALLVLITQRRENELSEARDQLTLELAILNEQKSAKIIALLEEQRRDTPFLPDRSDREADQLAAPTDPHAVFDALRTTPQDPRSARDPDLQPASRP